MRTVYIARQESDATVERVRKLLDDLKWGPDIQLERDDYTWVDWSDELTRIGFEKGVAYPLNGTTLLRMVQDTISGADA